MEQIRFVRALFLNVLFGLCVIQISLGLENFNEQKDKIDLRRELDKLTQELLVEKDPFYHSYVFNSGVGNREKLVVEWIKQESQFTAGEAVVRWQAIRNVDRIHLLGQKPSSVTLVTAATQLSSNRSAQFNEHSLNFEANVTSSSLFTRWNPDTLEPEVVAVIAIDTSANDILLYRVINGKLENITKWSLHRKVRCLTAVNVDGKNQLIVIDKGFPASIDVFDVLFTPESVKLDFRLVQSFAVGGECRSTTVCRVGRQHYLVLPLPQYIVVYRLVSGHYQKHIKLPLRGVSQVICFNVALQTYLAINGEVANVLRLTEGGEFVSELMPGNVSEWLVLPVSSYRSDVLLLSRAANLTKAYVWAGANRGFATLTIPHCDSCLEGDWLGAVYVPFQHQNCLLIPQVQRPSSLVIVGTSLYDNNPVQEKLKATVENMKKYQDMWQQVKSKMAELEETLRYTVKKNGTNVITGKWTIGKLEGPRLRLSSLVTPQNETDMSEEVVETEEAGPVQLETLQSAVQTVIAQGVKVVKAVEQREKEAWDLDGFRGKVTFKGRLIVDNLTISKLNNKPMDQLLHNTFRKDKPEPIQQIVIHELNAEDVVVDKINNNASENLKFSDGPVIVRSNITFERPLTVRGEVELEDGGRLNGVDLSEELCPGLGSCSVFPMVNLNDDEVRDLHTSLKNNPTTTHGDHLWSKTVAGKNLTVLRINGVDWKTLAQNAVYRNTYQNITGTVMVKGKVSSEPAIWADNIQYLHKSQPRLSGSEMSSPILEASGSQTRPVSGNRKFLDDLLTASEVIVSELEVTGTVLCGESEWGEDAADVVVGTTNPIVIKGDKTFTGAVNVTNNADVEGTVGGVVVSDLLTKDTEQVFYGPTTLHGVITLENVNLTGMWNGKNASDVFKASNVSYENISGREVTADSITVLETINGIPVTDIVFTDDHNVTKVKSVDADTIYVTENIAIEEKVCGLNLNDFNQRRLSLQKEQNITGKVSINKAKIRDFKIEKINDVAISSLLRDSATLDSTQTLYLSELHIDGDIVTTEGVNGFNITQVADDAVWLEANNEIEGPLIFKDEITCNIVDSQGYCNNEGCDYWLSVDDVVFKNNNSVKFSGKKSFLNLLNISGDLTVHEINSRQPEDILTKTTDQEIAGDMFIKGDVRVTEDSTVLGLLNGQNITEFGHRCLLSEDTISCKGNAVFKETLVVRHFSTVGKMNDVAFDTFVKSIVIKDEPQKIKGFKRFAGNTVVAENIEDVDGLNGESWDDFMSESVNSGGQEHVDHPVTFTNTLTLRELSVDYHMEADTINEINVSNWKTDAIYINESRALEREIRLASASSKDNISVEMYGGLNLEHDVVRLHSASMLPYLRAKAVTVVEDVEVTGTVNGKILEQQERNTLKVSGNQKVDSDVIVQEEVVIEGDLDTWAPVNQHDLRDVVTLASDQMLNGKYEFDCIEAQANVYTSEMISGINLTSWTQKGVLKNKSDQVISGVWKVQNTLEVKGPVVGKGTLAGVDLQQLTDNITRNVLEVHHQMKINLTSACEEANSKLALARSQPCKLQYLDVTQSLQVPPGSSLVTHFKNSDEDFLAVSENSCTTSIYKWNKSAGAFTKFHREMFGFSLRNFIILNSEQITYVVTESSELPSDCEYNGKHLWIFMKDHFKHVSSVDFFGGSIFQGEGNSLYVINSLGMSKYVLHFDHSDGRAYFKSEPHRWNITADVPKEWSGAAQYEWLSDIFTAGDCSGEVISVSVDPDQQFVAVASTEATQVPRHADYIKVYRNDGQLFDKLPAQNVSQLQWLSVPAQTWLVALQNHSSLNLYQLQGPVLGFQLQLSANIDATNVKTIALPLASKVNLQPYIILQTPSAVKIVRAFVQGDPYLGNDLSCSFDQVFIRVPRK